MLRRKNYINIHVYDTCLLIIITLSEIPSDEGDLKFSAADYVVFSISLAIPLGIGVFFFFYKRSEHSTEEFLVGDRSMNFVAVALSILASLLNGIFVIGTPAEMHYYGTQMALIVVGMAIAIIVTAHLFIPKYQSMKFTSAYEVSSPYCKRWDILICLPAPLNIRSLTRSHRLYNN